MRWSHQSPWNMLVRGTAGVTCLTTALSAHISAQPPIDTRIRLETQDGARHTGRVTSVHGDTIRLRVGARNNDTVTVLLQRMKTYAASAGRDRMLGAGYGVLAGGTVGAILVAVARHADRSSYCDCYVSNTMLAVPAGAVLTLVGAGLGALAAPERWGPSVSFQIASSPEHRRLHASIGLTF